MGSTNLNYRQKLEVIKCLSIAPETQTRIDCVFCNGKNTLSIDTTENKIGWYCFHASCSAKGKKEGEKNMQYVEKVYHGNQDLHIEDMEFKIPDSFKSIYSNEKEPSQQIHTNSNLYRHMIGELKKWKISQ